MQSKRTDSSLSARVSSQPPTREGTFRPLDWGNKGAGDALGSLSDRSADLPRWTAASPTRHIMNNFSTHYCLSHQSFSCTNFMSSYMEARQLLRISTHLDELIIANQKVLFILAGQELPGDSSGN